MLVAGESCFLIGEASPLLLTKAKEIKDSDTKDLTLQCFNPLCVRVACPHYW